MRHHSIPIPHPTFVAPTTARKFKSSTFYSFYSFIEKYRTSRFVDLFVLFCFVLLGLFCFIFYFFVLFCFVLFCFRPLVAERARERNLFSACQI
jgi:hypothetical protein